MLINELKKGVAYMQIKNKFFDSVKKVVENEMKISANSTTCGIFYMDFLCFYHICFICL